MSRHDVLTIQVGELANINNQRTVLVRQIADSLGADNPLARIIVTGKRDAYHQASGATLDPGIGFEGTIRITDGAGAEDTVDMHVQRWDMPETWEKKDDPIAERSPFRLSDTKGKLKSLVDNVKCQDIFPLPKKPTVSRLIFEEVNSTSLTASKGDRFVELPAKFFGPAFNMEHADQHESFTCEAVVRGTGVFGDVLNLNRAGAKPDDDDPQNVHFNSMFTLFVDMDLAVYSLEILDRTLVVGNGLTAPQYKLVCIELE